ncbi:RluA family pseudouridine synthase [Flavobacteriaceae bacterium]|jgi:23S rRNA pseudouridine1911/1915/1917 synthase|nr:RluA family pseudouridine synthase [Flavobacteriaceae bacterium]|tara:strand:- start:5527 stop:6210 length:684 start_codon:yes stop_codon:yes gene_type:complete
MDIKRRILFEDNHLIVVNKEAKELVQGDKTGDSTLADHLKAYLKIKYNKPGKVYIGIVHRIDRPTSGVLVFTKTSKALIRLNEQFKKRSPKKTYWAIVGKEFPSQEGKLIHWMTRNQKQNKSKAHKNEVPNSKIAKLSYRRIQEFEHYCLLEITLETGRHHQIRAQLSALGFPIQGDLKYGADRNNKDGSISLHARSLQIDHPVTKEAMSFKANPQKMGIWKSVLSC